MKEKVLLGGFNTAQASLLLVCSRVRLSDGHRMKDRIDGLLWANGGYSFSKEVYSTVYSLSSGFAVRNSTNITLGLRPLLEGSD